MSAAADEGRQAALWLRERLASARGEVAMTRRQAGAMAGCLEYLAGLVDPPPEPWPPPAIGAAIALLRAALAVIETNASELNPSNLTPPEQGP